LPEELARRESRLQKIQEAMQAIEEETREKDKNKDASDGDDKPKRGRKPSRPAGIPRDRIQRNFTDPESKIMVDGDKAFIQGYNAQAAVDASSQVIVAADVSDKSVDKQQVKPMIKLVAQINGEYPKELSADAGFFSTENVEWLQEKTITAYVAPDKQKHNDRAARGPRGRIPNDLPLIERMRRKLKTKEGRKRYALRKQTVEPVFGQIKGARGFRQFLLRGVTKVKGEWSLLCTAHNLLKLYRSKEIASLT
jgi:hypothetical protein